MRALTAKEKKLLIALLGALFVLLNAVALQMFLTRQSALHSNISKLNSQLAENRSVLGQKAMWDDRARWLEEKQPTDDVSSIDDDTKFTEFVESTAKKSGLTYTRRGGGPVQSGEQYAEVYDASQVKGKMEALVKWLSELQQPEAFRAIKLLRIKSAPEPPDVIADVEVARWYRPINQPTP